MKLWSIGRFDIRLSEDEFWSMTPIEFHSLLQRWREAQRILDLRSGMVASTIANVNRRKGSTPFKPEDFMLFREPEKVLSVEESRQYLEGLAAMFGGKVTRGTS